MFDKKFSVKVYTFSGIFIDTLDPNIIIDKPRFSSRINAGFGECSFTLRVPFENFDEGGVISFMNIFKIYVFDAENTKGRLVYTGFLSSYKPFLKSSSQGVEIILLGMISLLTFAYYKNGASYIVDQNGKDPSFIMKSIIDHFNTIYPAGLLGYNSGATTVDSVGVNVSYKFEEDKWLDALQNAFGTVNPGWWWNVDKQGQLYLKQKPSIATHSFTIGKDIEEIEVDKNAEDIANKVFIEYFSSATFTGSDAPSIAKYGTRELLVSDERVKDLTTATQRVNKEIADNKENKIKTKLTINSEYDIESIKVGDTCKITNLSKFSGVFTNNMLIVEVSYDFEKVTIQLEDLLSSLGAELKKLNP